MTSRSELRELITASEIVLSPSIYDGISARIVDQMGFETAMLGGGAVTNSRLTMPDYGFIGLSDMEEQLRAIASQVDLAVQVDADTGYGNPLNVRHTVKRLESAGAALIMLEDQSFPKRCGHFEGKKLIPVEQMMKKIEAAVDTRSDSDLLIMGRTDAIGPTDVDEAISRLNAYAEAGADVAMADALRSKEDIRRICQEVDVPVRINMGYGIRERPTTPLVSPTELEEMGVSMVVYGRLTTGAAARGIERAYQKILEQAENDEVIREPELTLDQTEYTSLMGRPELQELEKRYALRQKRD